MPGTQKATTPVTDVAKPTSATPARAPAAPAHPAAAAQGIGGNRAVAASLRPDTGAAGPVASPNPPGGAEPAPVRPPTVRQVREIVLKKAEKVLEYRLGDGSTQTEALIFYVDFPPGTYTARPVHDRPLFWALPPQLNVYVQAEGYRSTATGPRYGVQTDHADHAKNTGTFEGVESFDFVVVGARTLPDGGASTLDVDDLLDSAEIRRYRVLRGHRGGSLPDRTRPDAPLPPDQIAALMRLRDQLSELTETDWAVLAVRGPAAGPAGTWTDEQEQLDRYVQGPERASALKAEAERDAQIQAARSEIDPKRQSAAITRLKGTEKLYEAIVESEFTTSENSVPSVEAAAFFRMQDQLKAHRFRAVAEFDAAAIELRTVVRRQAILHALLSLSEGERVLQAELQRYRNMAEVNRLATALKTAPADAGAAGAISVRTEYPLLRDKVVYDGAKASKYPENLEELLLQNIEAQFGNVRKSRKALHDDPDLVFSFDLVIDETLQALGLPRESAQAQLIRARRGVSPSVLDIVQPVLMVLCFAAGPLGWIAYAANLAALGIQIYETHEKEREKDLVAAAGHAGNQLATKQRIHGVMEAISSILEPLGIIGGALGVFHLPPTPAQGATGAVPGEMKSLLGDLRSSPVTEVPHVAPGEAGFGEADLGEADLGSQTARAETDIAGAETDVPRAEDEAPHAEGSVGAAGVHEDAFEANRFYDDSAAAAGGEPGPAAAKPVNGQRALDDSFPVELYGRDPAAPVERIGVDVEHQELVVLTRSGDRIQAGEAAGGTYRGRVVAWDDLSPKMRKVLSDEGVRVDPTGRITVPERWADLDPGIPTVRDRVTWITDAVDFRDTTRGITTKPATGRPRTARGPDGEPLTPSRPPKPSKPSRPKARRRPDIEHTFEEPPSEFTVTLPRPLSAAEKEGKTVITRRVVVETPDGETGWVTRSWDPDTGTWTNLEAEFSPNLPRWVQTEPPLVPGKGTPLETYLTMGLMRWFRSQGIRIPKAYRLVIDNVRNLSSIAVLGRARMYGVPVESALLKTRTVRYAENSVIQRGGRIAEARVVKPGTETTWGQITDEAARAEVLRETGLTLPLDAPVPTGYSVEIAVEPVGPKSPAPPVPDQ